MNLQRVFEKHPDWPSVLETTHRLKKSGYTALLAGGCVRDALMGRLPQDFDIATDAQPEDVIKIFPQALGVGQHFGVMMLPIEDGRRIEVATFRADLEYKDGRRPEGVRYSDAREDALRRDFTVNALFYDLIAGEVIDYVEGLADLEKRVLRAVGLPKDRFIEDKLRMLRAIRFQAQLGFQIEPQTWSAICELAKEIAVVSKERITDEFRKMAKTPRFAEGLENLRATGLLRALWAKLSFPEASPDLWQKTLTVMSALNRFQSLDVLLALLILEEKLSRGMEAPSAIQWDDLPIAFSREMKREIEFLVRGYFVMEKDIDAALLLLTEELGPVLTEFCYTLEAVGQFSAGRTGQIVERFLSVANEQGYLPKPLLTGNDILSLGFEASKQVGEILEACYRQQLRGEIQDRAQALQFIEKNYRR